MDRQSVYADRVRAVARDMILEQQRAAYSFDEPYFEYDGNTLTVQVFSHRTHERVAKFSVFIELRPIDDDTDPDTLAPKPLELGAAYEAASSAQGWQVDGEAAVSAALPPILQALKESNWRI